MKKILKKSLVVLISLPVILIAAAVAVPYFFKDDILRAVKKDINRQIDARVEFDDVSLSIFKHFPDVYFNMKNFRIDSTGPRHDITLARIKNLGLTVDAIKLLKGSKTIKSITLDQARFHIYVTADGQANYDIFKNSARDSVEENDGGLEMNVKSFKASNSFILYDDRSMDLKLLAAGINHEGNIQIKDDRYDLQGTTFADTLDLTYDNIRYLRNVKAVARHEIGIQNGFSEYILKNVEGELNALPVSLHGNVNLKDDGIDMDLQFSADDNRLNKFLSLVPTEFMPDVSAADISGTARLEGFVKGRKTDSLYPGYGVDFDVKNGRIRDKSTGTTLENLHIRTRVAFPGGPDLDATVLDMPRIEFTLAGNHARGFFHLRHPLRDPWIHTALAGKINLNDLSRIITLPGLQELKGTMDENFQIKGYISDFEKGNYLKTDARGYLSLTDFYVRHDSLLYPISVPSARSDITPAALEIKNTQVLAEESDFNIKGKIENYLSYFTGKDSILRARLQIRSRKTDFNRLSGSSQTARPEDTTSNLRAPRIPADLDIVVKTRIDTLIYKNMQLRHVQSDLHVRDQKVSVTTLLSRAFGGQMKLSGLYDTSEDLPYSRINLVADKARLNETASHLAVMQYYTPVLQEINGIINLNFQLGTRLDSTLRPVFSTTDAGGEFSSRDIRPQHVEIIKKIASLLHLKSLENPVIDKVKARFEIQKGNLNIKPFRFKINGMESEMGGKVNLDRQLDLIWDLQIPVTALGQNANEWLNRFAAPLRQAGIKPESLQTVYVRLHITGDMMHPHIKPVFRKGEGVQGLTETLEETLTQAAEEKLDEAKQRAAREAEALIRRAEEQGDALIREAQKAADKIRAEADKQARKLIEQAKNPLAKIAAEKAAEKLRKEADRKARELMEKARREKEKLMENARKKARRLTETRLDSLQNRS